MFLPRQCISAVVLAGGQSRRMGCDKALLPIDKAGTTLLRKTFDVAMACAGQVFIVSPCRPGWPTDTQWIIENSPGQGPLWAFQESLAVVESEWVLLLACDLPYLEAEILHRWIAELVLVPPEAIAYLAPHETKQGSGWQCLCGFYRSSCQQRVAAITNVNEQMFTNWNYPADVVNL
jgi:molybdenum cofactor guanylyltransferase